MSEPAKVYSTEGKFVTGIFSLEELGNSRYLIPTYQRPYVWKYANISKLLSDFWSAYTSGADHYFIGTILTSVQNGKEELIDGQQRFTTLWLVGVAFKALGVESEINNYLKAGKELRFDFAIRHKLKDYLTLLMEDEKLASLKYPEDVVEDDEYLVYIAKAITTIRNIINSNSYTIQHTKEGFADYIYKNIQFVKNTAPVGINLHKLFTTINNSGVQLEQTDILKSNLLRHIKTEKLLYSRIWEACENMEDYFERNVRKSFKESDWSDITPEDFKKFNGTKFLFRPNSNQNTFEGSKQTKVIKSLYEILQEADDEDLSEISLNNGGKNNEVEGRIVRCESILSFGQLLLHTYRVFLSRNDEEDFKLPFHVKNLLQIFKCLEKLKIDDHEDIAKERREERIKLFFECLWEVRYAFDKHIIKWVEKPGEKDRNLVLMGLSIDKKTNQLNYSQKEKSELSMLQSVLYFTSNYNTQIWLSPLLKRIIDGEEPIVCLESIDNELSLSTLEDKETTYLLMDKAVSIQNNLSLVYELNSSHYPKFKHYWFQKLEYVLWKNWDKKDDPKYREYRITSRNSLEHVFPQNHEFGETIDKNTLHSFGNLALLNVSQNSSYSHQAVGKKKIDFFSPAKPAYDSLKLYYVYSDPNAENWKEKHIEYHQQSMVEILDNHYKRNI